MKQCLLSAVLALCMTFTALPVTTHAADNPSETTSIKNAKNIKNIDGNLSGVSRRKGDSIIDTDSESFYKITKIAASNGAGGTVSYMLPENKKATSISIPAIINLDGVSYKVTKICKDAFKNNINLKNVIIGKNVKTIGNSAFYGCENLEKVTIGNNVEAIWSYAFYGCKNLAKVTIPAKVKVIGKQVFYGCTKLKNITVESADLVSDKMKNNLFEGGSENTAIEVLLPKY